MEELPKKEIRRLRSLSIADEERRDRQCFLYSFDIMSRNWAFPFSIWSMPNEDVLRVISQELNLDDIPFENLNEFNKGGLFKEFCQFVAEQLIDGEEMLCEARNYNPCFKDECPFFLDENKETGEKFYICSEFKTVFRKNKAVKRISK